MKDFLKVFHHHCNFLFITRTIILIEMAQKECIFIMFYICLYIFPIPSKVMKTAEETFGICSKSFLEYPSMTLPYKQDPQFVCIPQEKNKGTDLKCGKEQEQMCIAVLYLPDYKIPLFSGFHIRGDPSGKEVEVGRNFNQWVTSALTREGLAITSTIKYGSWLADNTRTGVAKGHLVPAKLAALINNEMSLATFNMFNVAPQYGSQNAVSGGKLEKNLEIFAKQCKLELEYRKAPNLPSLPREKKWEKGVFTFDKENVHTDFILSPVHYHMTLIHAGLIRTVFTPGKLKVIQRTLEVTFHLFFGLQHAAFISLIALVLYHLPLVTTLLTNQRGIKRLINCTTINLSWTS